MFLTYNCEERSDVAIYIKFCYSHVALIYRNRPRSELSRFACNDNWVVTILNSKPELKTHPVMKRKPKNKTPKIHKPAASSSIPSILKMVVYRRLKEGSFIAIAAFSLFLMLALFTYQDSDPGWRHTGTQMEISNAAGHVGAYLADFLFYLFGYMAYIFPFPMVYLGWLFFLRQPDPAETLPHYILLTIKCLSLTLLFLTGCAVFSAYLASPPGDLVGGIVGYGISHQFVRLFNPMGASLVMLTLMVTAITFLTGFSWLHYVRKIAVQLLTYFKDKRPLAEAETYFSKKTTPAPENKQPVFSAAPNVREPSTPPPPPEPKLAMPSIVVPKAPERKNLSPIKTHLSLDLLDISTPTHKKGYTQKELRHLSSLVELKLKDFNVTVQVVAVHPGPVITRFELQLAPGTKASKVSNLAKDLARSMSVISVRVVEVIEGKSVIGLELPNKEREMVRLHDILSSSIYQHAEAPLTLALGKDIAGHPVTANLAKMPHLLVAGTTGSGKSVGVNAMLLSLLYKSSPDQLRLILIDPKMLELSIYDGIPHLLAPVVTDMKDAARALRWCVMEMERRYKLMAKLGVRNLSGFNQKVSQAMAKNEPIPDPFWDPQGIESTPESLKPLPYIVVVADEFADMIMVVGKKVEELITRIAQKARAAGIHLILATQRPSVDVITGLIKANVPSRIAFQVSSKIDSRTILDQSGAEQLLGHGDMLYLAPGKGQPIRVHGAFVDDNEVHRVTSELKTQGAPEYIDAILSGEEGGSGSGTFDDSGFELENPGEKDALYDQAVQIVIQSRKASVSNVQRRLKIGYNRAARLVETMEAAGLVSPMNSNGTREVLVPAQPEHVS